MRVGILVDSRWLTGWRKAVFRGLLETEQTRIVLSISNNDDAGRARSASAGAWDFFDRIERKLAKRFLHGRLARARGFSPALLDSEPLDLSAYQDAPRVSVSEASAIAAAELDVLLDLSCSDAGIDPSLARLGVWRLASRRAPQDRHSPLGFWALYRGEPLSEIAVVRRREDGVEEEIAWARHCNFMWSWSVNDTLLGMQGASLLNGAMQGKRSQAPLDPTSPRSRAVLQAPILFARTYARLAADAAERALCEDRWRILLSRGDGQRPTVIEPPRHSYWADPFVVRRGEQCHIFFEEYFFDTRRGVISHVCVGDPKPGDVLRNLKSTVIIDQPHHLSYPFLFEHNGELFMIPESSAARTVEAWRATDFPLRWERAATLLSDVSAADTSLLQHNGRWWLFTNIDSSGARDHRSELHIFHADDPIAGPWIPHALNPVVVDARCGRMAGGFLKAADGRPIRCGQMQGRRYGQEVSYRLITELSETAYSETSIEGVAPLTVSKGARTHHVAARDGMVVADECFVGLKRPGASRR